MPAVTGESAARILCAIAAGCGVAAIVIWPFLLAPVGLLALLVAAKLSADARLTRAAAVVLAVGALAGTAVAAGFSRSLY